jgi:hypothetical protein
MDHYLPSFRLEFPGTYNEYRIVEGHVQFRPEQGHWRTMDVEDIRMHFALRTPVASWIRATLAKVTIWLLQCNPGFQTPGKGR